MQAVYLMDEVEARDFLCCENLLLEALESCFVTGRGVFEGAAAFGEMAASEGIPCFILFKERNFSFRES